MWVSIRILLKFTIYYKFKLLKYVFTLTIFVFIPIYALLDDQKKKIINMSRCFRLGLDIIILFPSFKTKSCLHLDLMIKDRKNKKDHSFVSSIIIT